MGPLSGTVEEEIGRIAGRSHGVVTREELIRAGISPTEIRRRLRKGAVLRVYPGVYRVGHQAPSLEAHYMAAVKACGPGAFLSGPAAASLFGLLKASQPIPDVTAPTNRNVRGVRTHRSQRIDERDLTRHHRILVTSVPRTLVDLAALLNAQDLARACHEAGVRYGTTPRQVDAVLVRRPNSPGARKLREVMSGDVRVTLGKLEARFLSMLRAEGLSLPQTNRHAGGRGVDCRWPELKLTIELDGYRYHRSRHAWELDRLREREAYARGDDFRRYTYGDVLEQPRLMMAELQSLLRR